MTVASEPKVVAVKPKEPFAGFVGAPQLTMAHVAVSQAPLARHEMEAAERVYPVLQVTAADDP